MNLLIECLKQYDIATGTIIIVGDFNCSNVDWVNNSCTGDVTGKILLNFAVSNSFTQFVNFPTRADNVLDLVFASDECAINRVLPSPSLGHSDQLYCRF